MSPWHLASSARSSCSPRCVLVDLGSLLIRDIHQNHNGLTYLGSAPGPFPLLVFRIYGCLNCPSSIPFKSPSALYYHFVSAPELQVGRDISFSFLQHFLRQLIYHYWSSYTKENHFSGALDISWLWRVQYAALNTRSLRWATVSLRSPSGISVLLRCTIASVSFFSCQHANA